MEKRSYALNRVILHVDMDAFFASIEQKDNPSYRGRPVIVGADPKGGKGRGVVSTASYEARKYGIHSAMPISKAYALCPNGIYVRPRMERYIEESKKIMSILGEFSPIVEQISIDEAFLDCTGTERLFGEPIEIGRKIKERIKKKTSLTASVGIGSSKSVAKIASDLRKPNGLTYCPPGKEMDFLYNLELYRLWGAGKKTIEKLKKSGYNRIGDIAMADIKEIVSLLGKNGMLLWQLSRGIDPRPVEPLSPRKSIGREVTYQRDLDDIELVEKTIMRIVDFIAFEMRKRGIKGKKVILKIRLEDFSTFTRGKTLNCYTDSSRIIRETAIEKFRNFDRSGKKVRLIGVSVSELVFWETYQPRQGALFENLYEGFIGSNEKKNNETPNDKLNDKLQDVLEEMKLRYGDAIDRAIFLNNKK